MMPGEPRFLQYRTPRPPVGGLLDLSGRLALLLREAHVTGRLAILPPLTLDPRYNFGVRREWRWEHYFDLGASRLTDAAGRRHPLPIADCRPGDGVRTLRLRGGTLMPDRARDYPLVVRRLSHLSSLGRQLPVAGWPAATVDLLPAARAAALARPVVERLRSLGGGRFVAMHVRRGDRIALGEVPDRLTQSAHVGRCLRDRGVAAGAVVYIATDERDPDFWRPLQDIWRVFRHADFPALDALVSGAGEAPDNYLLFQVEREILREGHLRLGTMPNRDWAHMHGWFIDPKDWPPSKMRSPGARRRWLVNRVRRLGAPVLRVEEMLPRNLSGMLGSARKRAAAVLRRLA